MSKAKIFVLFLSFFVGACAALPEHQKLKKIEKHYQAQARTAAFVQSYLNVPQTSIQNYAWWSTAEKVKERDENIKACLQNAQHYNRLALQSDNLSASWLPKQLDEKRCLPICDGDSAIDKTCYGNS